LNNIIKYSKANGTGNNFIVVIDEGSSNTFSKAFIQEICNYKSNNRYDNFKESFYRKAQNSFLKIAKNNSLSVF